MAALTLAAHGRKICMVDVGYTGDPTCSPPLHGTFEELRKNDPAQYKYFLTDLLSEEIGTGAQLTPARRYMLEGVKELIPLLSRSFFPMESLAMGGLGVGWGLGCCMYSDQELQRCGLETEPMRKAYQWVSDRIGISGAVDDAGPFTISGLHGIQKPVQMDQVGIQLERKYQEKREVLRRSGFHMGRTALALLTEDMGERKGYACRELDFYDNAEESAWRPDITLKEMMRKGELEYIPGYLVKSFREENGKVRLQCVSIRGEEKQFEADRLVLAAGALGTARIVLNSFPDPEHSLPLLCNQYQYIPGFQWGLLGKSAAPTQFGYSQLSLFYDPSGDGREISMASIYSYRQLLYYRLLLNAPFSLKTNQRLFRALLPALTIFGIHHPAGNPGLIRLRKEGELFRAEFIPDENWKQENARRNKVFVGAMRTLSCFPIKQINPGMGSSIHYAGSLPFSDQEKMFSISTRGRLHGTERVFVADGSGFTFLPAKGLTFSLMANAHNVATNILKGIT